MADLKDKPEPFRKGQMQISATDLNEIREALPRLLRGGGPANTRWFGDRLVAVKRKESLNHLDQILSQFIVLYEFDDVLQCVPFIQPSNSDPNIDPPTIGMLIPQVYDPMLGRKPTDFLPTVWVAKPYILQRTPWDGQTVDLYGVPTTYTYDVGLGQRHANTTLQKITPQYFPGDVITAERIFSGYYDPNMGGEPVAWMDINAGGRIWDGAKIVALTKTGAVVDAAVTSIKADPNGNMTWLEVAPGQVQIIVTANALETANYISGIITVVDANTTKLIAIEPFISFIPNFDGTGGVGLQISGLYTGWTLTDHFGRIITGIGTVTLDVQGVITLPVSGAGSTTLVVNPANGPQWGVVTNSFQTFQGDKEFLDTVQLLGSVGGGVWGAGAAVHAELHLGPGTTGSTGIWSNATGDLFIGWTGAFSPGIFSGSPPAPGISFPKLGNTRLYGFTNLLFFEFALSSSPGIFSNISVTDPNGTFVGATGTVTISGTHLHFYAGLFTGAT